MIESNSILEQIVRRQLPVFVHEPLHLLAVAELKAQGCLQASEHTDHMGRPGLLVTAFTEKVNAWLTAPSGDSSGGK
jgi:hypothetical protein